MQSVTLQVLNIGIELPADGVGDAGTPKTVRMYIKCAYVGVMKEQFQQKQNSRNEHCNPQSSAHTNKTAACYGLQNRICSEQQLH